VWRASSRCGLALVGILGVVLAGGCQAADVGQAELLNESGKGDLTVVVVDAEGLDSYTTVLDDNAYLDTQWVDRELQCLVEEDGHLEIRDAAGDVLVRHDFADRPVCEGDVIVLGEDGSLTWE
jgi:hypothetical protein